MRKLGPDPALLSKEKKKLRTPSDLFGTLRRNSTHNLNNWLTDRNISGNTLLANSPLHDVQRERKFYKDGFSISCSYVVCYIPVEHLYSFTYSFIFAFREYILVSIYQERAQSFLASYATVWEIFRMWRRWKEKNATLTVKHGGRGRIWNYDPLNARVVVNNAHVSVSLAKNASPLYTALNFTMCQSTVHKWVLELW